MFNKYICHPPKTGNRRPVCTLAEFAKSKGIIHQTLHTRGCIGRVPLPPVQLKERNRIYYRIGDLEIWHKKYEQELKAMKDAGNVKRNN